jgi:adenylyltransferase/sulfurtransferase
MTAISVLNTEQRLRYQRQLILPEIGETGQEKLKSARICIAGLGGLGSISSYYMAAAGIGFIRIIDSDCVAPENLNRQIIHRTEDLSRPKTESAMEKLQALNSHCNIEPVQQKINEENAVSLVSDCALILDATDNLETRKVLNRASVSKGIPFIYGGINGFNGMVSTLIPGQTPCMECLFPLNSEQTNTIGVIGPVAGLVASIQSLEAIKLLLGMDGLLKYRLLYFRGADMSFKEIRVEKNPDCKVCGPGRK